MATATASQRRADKGGGVGEYTFLLICAPGWRILCVKVICQRNALTRLSICLFVFSFSYFFYLFKRAFLSFFVPPSFGKKRDLSFDA